MLFKKIIAILHIFVQNKIIASLQPSHPAQLRVFYIGGYWRGPNDIVAQMLHGLQNTGAITFEFNTDKNPDALDTENRPYDRGTSGPVWLRKQKLFPLILQFRPHLIICNAGGLSFRSRDTMTLKKWGIKFLGIALSEPDVYELTTSKIAHNFDIFYSNDKHTVELHRSHGIECYQLPMATDDTFFHPVPSQPEYECEVLHLGAAHPDRIEAVKALAQHFNTHVYGERWENYGINNRGVVLGEDTRYALSSAKIVVVFSRTAAGHQIIKPQLFNFLSAGCLVATEVFPDLIQYFEPGRELIGFDGIDDLLLKVKYYLEHFTEANALRQAGREKALQYTWEKVWPRLLAPIVFPSSRQIVESERKTRKMKTKLLSSIKKSMEYFRASVDLFLLHLSPLFDRVWYLDKNPDVLRAKMDPFLHYLGHGGFEGRDPGPTFSSSWYLKAYPDVKNAGTNPLIHYIRYGQREGRLPRPVESTPLQHKCPVCKNDVHEFLPLSPFYDQNFRKFGFPYTPYDFETLNVEQYSCPHCGTSDRCRLYACYLGEKIPQYPQGQTINILDIAPSAQLSQFIDHYQNVIHHTADLFAKDVDFVIDVTDMSAIASNSYDILICSHVLEHVVDDRKALSELYRVLKPSGWGIIMVPINLAIQQIEEDPQAADVSERWRRFGQDDHIRLYSKAGFIERVKAAGFKLRELGVDHFGISAFREYGITSKSVLYIAEKL